MKKNKQNLPLGIILMLTASLLTCVGQLCWKLSASGALWLVLVGFVLYGWGELLMVVALHSASHAERGICAFHCSGRRGAGRKRYGVQSCGGGGHPSGIGAAQRAGEKGGSAMLIGIALLMTFLGSLGAFFLKKSTGGSLGLRALLCNRFLYLGGVFYVAGALLNIALITYIWTLVLSALFLQEKITLRKLLGVAFIVFGVFLLTRG